MKRSINQVINDANGICDGLLMLNDIKDINSIDPSYKVNAKIKGTKGDRGAVKVPVSSILDGSCLLDGEFISQVWV